MVIKNIVEKIKTHKSYKQTFLVLAILIFSSLIMLAFTRLKINPKKTNQQEEVLFVEGIKVHKQDFPVVLTGYGTIWSKNRVDISAQVGGIVEYIYPNLEVGAMVLENEVLIQIDKTDYELALKQAQAQVNLLENELKLLKQQEKNDQEILKIAQRQMALSKAEYERNKKLYSQEKIGSLSLVEAKEQAYRLQEQQVQQIKNALSLYELKQTKLKQQLTSAKAQLKIAKVNLNRTTIRAPFTGRIDFVDVELGELVTPGRTLFRVVDESSLEISVPLETEEVFSWLLDSKPRPTKKSALVTSKEKAKESQANQKIPELTNWAEDYLSLNPKKAPVKIYWPQNPDLAPWYGTIARMERVETKTRTINVIISICSEPPEGIKINKKEKVIPLVEGMFCRVEIPGRTLNDVFVIPEAALNDDFTVYTASSEQRLVTKPVEILLRQGKKIILSSGLEEGDIVITTKLVEVLDGMKLNVNLDQE